MPIGLSDDVVGRVTRRLVRGRGRGGPCDPAPVQGKAHNTCEYQTCLGPCLLVWGSRRVWHTSVCPVMATEIVYAVWPAPVWPLIATAMLATDRGDGVGEFASHDFGRHGHGQSSPSGPRPQQSSNCRLRCSGRCDLARKGLRSWLASNCSLLGVTQAPVAHLGPFSGVRERGSSCSMLRRRSRRACFFPGRSGFLALANLRHLRCYRYYRFASPAVTDRLQVLLIVYRLGGTGGIGSSGWKGACFLGSNLELSQRG